MIVDVAVVGAGQLGSRHLQALARLSRPARVWVSDPSPAALETAAARWKEAAPGAGLSADFSGRLPQSLDCAIVATDAAAREAAVSGLLKGRAVRYLILEKLLAQSPEGLRRLEALLGGAKAWVNCPRRLWPAYRALKPALPLDLAVTGTGWGLASNAVHFLDLAAYYTGRADWTLDGSGLSREEEPSKRPGFVELHGSLSARCGEHRVRLESVPGPRRFTVSVGGAAVSEDGAPKQSELTHAVVEDLLARGDCGLAPFAESAALHAPFLETLRAHWRAVKDARAECCPVT